MKKLTVGFYLKSDKARNGLCPIYGIIKLGNTSSTFSTGKLITKERWSSTNRLLKPLKLKQEILVKSFIYQIPIKAEELYQKLYKSNSLNLNITAKDICNILFGKEKTQHEVTIMEVADYHNKHFRLQVIKGERSKGSEEKYYRMSGVVKEYLESRFHCKDFDVCKINSDFIYGLDNFLRNERRRGSNVGIGHNTTVKYMRNISVMFNYALKRGLIKTNPFNCYDETIKEVPTIYLTSEELDKIESKQITIPRLELVRDVFLFSCYTALAPVDTMKLTWMHISIDSSGCTWILTNWQKTMVNSNVPLLRPVERIINKYKSDPRCAETKSLLPKISNAKMNAYLKEIADICGISKNLTWYVSRHTFATTVALSNGIPLEVVSKIMGHKRITQTQHYAKILDETVKKSMQELNKKYD